MNKEEKIILTVFVTSLDPSFVLLELLPRHIVDDVLIKRPITTLIQGSEKVKLA